MKPAKDKEQRKIDAGARIAREWQVKPLKWVKDTFGDNILKIQRQRGAIRDGVFVYTGAPVTETGLTHQQEDALRQWGELIEAKLFAAEGKPMTPKQVELSKKIGMSIQSSNGNGKDFLAALVTWHFESCFAYARGMATANTGKQLTNVFWSALADIRSLALKPDPNNPESLNILQENFELQSEKLFAKLPNKDDRGKRWFCEAVTINTKASAEEQGEALAGRHADHMIVVVDEASGIPDAVFKPIDRTLTGKLNLCFMIFNPTSNTGFAIDSQTKNREMWIPLHWDAMSSDNVPRSQIERLKRYGEDSPAYRIGVLGLPPLVDGNTLIPYDWIRAAIGRELEVGDHDPVMMGADIGAGGDRSVVCLRKGGKVLDFKRSSNPNTPDLADWIGATMDEEDAAVCFVDNIGVGWGVFTTLQKLRYTVRAADSRKSSDNERFLNKRAEIYWKLREQFEHGLISLPEPVDEGDDNDPIVCLTRELGAIRNEITGKKEKILDKKDIRRAIGFSPDHADALMMSYFKPDSLFRKSKGKNANKIDWKGVYLR
jgi:hypothetical protein